jgi:hypothetical protein
MNKPARKIVLWKRCILAYAYLAVQVRYSLLNTVNYMTLAFCSSEPY